MTPERVYEQITISEPFSEGRLTLQLVPDPGDPFLYALWCKEDERYWETAMDMDRALEVVGRQPPARWKSIYEGLPPMGTPVLLTIGVDRGHPIDQGNGLAVVMAKRKSFNTSTERDARWILVGSPATNVPGKPISWRCAPKPDGAQRR